MQKNIYLERYAYPTTFIKTPPPDSLGIIVTIPCFNEPNLIDSLQSIYNCTRPNCATEVIVVINDGEQSTSSVKSQNSITYRQAIQWAEDKNTPELLFHIIYAEDLPKKHAGVGLARKIAMDEAVKRLESIGNKKGIISCFDADSLCETNYLIAIETHFNQHQRSSGCSIHFEHPLDGELPASNYEAIIDYELFLRYYTHGLRFVGLPYAFQTVGSSMAVRSDAYQKQGGMNKRHAGEDFYFLHKIIALGNFSVLNTTSIIPSPRQSDRVPFGTGKAINEWLYTQSLATYAPQTYIDLKVFIASVDDLWENTELEDYLNHLPKCISTFLIETDFKTELKRIKKNSSSSATFLSNFYQWFNAFKVLKFIHYARDHYYPNVPVYEAASWLLQNEYDITIPHSRDALLAFREIDRNC
ncbi:MAG: hypothetical protein OEX22_08760 [Cyclobacteriaceae bacterium]|nr:hypothetical protein [Cyclobacteriaceae bacterium]